MSTRPNRFGEDDWRAIAVVTMYLAGFLTALALGAAWWGASGTASVRDQIAWLNLGVGALVVGVSVGLVAVVQVRRRVAAELLVLVDGLERLEPDRSPTHRPSSADRASDPVCVARDDMRHYHRDTCPLVRGKPVAPQRQRDHEAAGRRACGVCQP